MSDETTPPPKDEVGLMRVLDRAVREYGAQQPAMAWVETREEIWRAVRWLHSKYGV